MSSGRTAGAMYAGLMSGTSMDGIDAALLAFGDHECSVLATATTPYPDSLSADLLHASRHPDECTVDRIGELDRRVGECFRDAVLDLLQKAQTDADDVVAIGSHGQTLRHQPDARYPFTLQIGDPNVIATGTGITTVADFRRADIVLGGQGAPLAPAFHHWLFADQGRNRIVLNIGGFANITLLAKDDTPVTGFDTGPGNSLLDAMARQHLGTDFDEAGAWARGGRVVDELLKNMLADPYFSAPPPKSTGFEYFNADWLATHRRADLPAVDVQATLVELTSQSIGIAIRGQMPEADEILVCGGGVHNAYLLERLSAAVAPATVGTTADAGLDPDWVEAAAFAWLAKRRLEGNPGNLPGVTGASREAVLGAVYLCAS